jgi:arsenate reductase (thioredoxin)
VFESYAALRHTAKITIHVVPLITHFATARLTALAHAQGTPMNTAPEALFVCAQRTIYLNHRGRWVSYFRLQVRGC